MEDMVYELCNAGIAVELLVPSRSQSATCVGIRLRTYGKALPSDRMILTSGDSFKEALDRAYQEAVKGHWSTLDWAARPWPVNGDGSGHQFTFR